MTKKPHQNAKEPRTSVRATPRAGGRETAPKPAVTFVSLGCPKNLVDSEKMLGLLAEAGCPIVGDGMPADVLVVNTCGFLAASREEALDVIRDAVARKRCGEIGRIVVAGCLVQRDGEHLLQQIPEIDALVGVHHRADLVKAVIGARLAGKHREERPSGRPQERRLAGEHPGKQPATPRKKTRGRSARPTASPTTRPSCPETPSNAKAGVAASLGVPDPAAGPKLCVGPFDPSSWTGGNRIDRARLRLTPAHYAYLRISEGCSQKCTFCTIPSIRGPLHSKTPPEILAEARELVADGAVELVLIGQDTTNYGRDFADGPGLAELLRRLDRQSGAAWIRLMYAYPTALTDEMIAAIADCEHVVKYVDLPLQHVNDKVLKAMRRRVTRRQTEQLLDKLRSRIPGVSIRTTFIVGFPGETEAAFEELVRFVRDFGFDALGAFAYSDEPETPAYRIRQKLPTAAIEARLDELMRTQQEIAFAKAASRAGQVMRVLVDAVDGGTCVARHQGQAPEVDSAVLLQARRHRDDRLESNRLLLSRLRPGQFVDVCCTGSRGYDLIAQKKVSGSVS